MLKTEAYLGNCQNKHGFMMLIKKHVLCYLNHLHMALVIYASKHENCICSTAHKPQTIQDMRNI